MPDVIINGPVGRLEGFFHPGKNPESPMALVLHPEPNKNGTMNNRVSYASYRLFQEHGFAVMRFNFRGVGRSEPAPDPALEQGEGELADAAAVIDWLLDKCPSSNICWICGFSFGSWIGMQLMMRRPEITGFISLSPPAITQDFTFLAPCPVSGLIIHGNKNEIVPQEGLDEMVEKIPRQTGVSVDVDIINGANHFFSTHLDEAMQSISRYLKRTENGNNMPKAILKKS